MLFLRIIVKIYDYKGAAVCCVICVKWRHSGYRFVCCTTPLVFLCFSLTVTHLLTNISLKCYAVKWVTTPRRPRSVVVVIRWLSFGCTMVHCHEHTGGAVFIAQQYRALVSVHLFCTWRVQLCEELPRCLSSCPSVSPTPLQCCVNTYVSLTNLMHQSSISCRVSLL